MTDIPVSVVWGERYPHLYIRTEMDIQDYWREVGSEHNADEEIANTKFIEVPFDLVLNYRHAMTLLKEVERQISEIQKETK